MYGDSYARHRWIVLKRHGTCMRLHHTKVRSMGLLSLFHMPLPSSSSSLSNTHKGEKAALQQQSRVHSHLLSQDNSKLPRVPRVPRIHSLRQRGFAFWTTNLPCSHPRSDQPTKNKAQEIRFPLSDPSLSLSFYQPTRIPTIHHLSLIHCRSTKRRQTKRKAHSFLVPNYCLVRVAGTPISLQLESSSNDSEGRIILVVPEHGGPMPLVANQV